MQKFVNNWSGTLQAPLGAADSEMQLPAYLAALLLLGEGDHYDLTIDPLGPAPEIVRVTAVDAETATLGARGLEGTAAPTEWPAGVPVQCCVTAGLLARLQASGGGLEDAPQDGEIYGRVAGEWDVIPSPNLSGYVWSVDDWWNWTRGAGVTGTLRNSYLEFDLPEEPLSSRKRLAVVEIDAVIAAQDAGPVDVVLGYTPGGYADRISPTPVIVTTADDWEVGQLYQDGTAVRLATKAIDLTAGGAVRFAGVMPYPARSDA